MNLRLRKPIAIALGGKRATEEGNKKSTAEEVLKSSTMSTWGDVAVGAYHMRHGVHLLAALQKLCEPEVCKSCVKLIIQQNIATLDISMEDGRDTIVV